MHYDLVINKAVIFTVQFQGPQNQHNLRLMYSRVHGRNILLKYYDFILSRLWFYSRNITHFVSKYYQVILQRENRYVGEILDVQNVLDVSRKSSETQELLKSRGL